MKHLLALAATTAFIWAAPVSAQNSSTSPDLSAAIAADYDRQLKDLILDFHQNPELSYKSAAPVSSR